MQMNNSGDIGLINQELEKGYYVVRELTLPTGITLVLLNKIKE